jgi:hypothetical protein
MRWSPLLPASLLVLGGLSACAKDTLTPVDTDAGVTPVDAAVVDAGATADAGVAPDAEPAVDTGVAEGMVRVEVIIDGEPGAGLPVIVHDVTGGLMTRDVTGPDGLAFLPMTEPGMITVAVADDSLRTWTGVEPGDNLVLRLGDAAGGFDVRLNLPAFPGNARFAQVHTGCGTEFTRERSVSLAIPPSCVSNGTVDLLAVALSRGGSTGWNFVPDVQVFEGQPVEVDAPEWRNDWRTVNLEITDAPPQATGVSVRSGPRRGGREYLVSRSFLPASQGAAALVIRGPVDVPDIEGELAHQLDVVFPFRGGDGDSVSSITRSSAETGTVSLSLTGLLPAISTAGLRLTDDSQRPELFWQIDGEPAGEDGQVIDLTWAQGRTQWEWLFAVSPSSSGPLRVPVLPDDLVGQAPSARTEVFQVTGYLLDVDGLEGWDGFRRTVGPSISGVAASRYSYAQIQTF